MWIPPFLLSFPLLCLAAGARGSRTFAGRPQSSTFRISDYHKLLPALLDKKLAIVSKATLMMALNKPTAVA